MPFGYCGLRGLIPDPGKQHTMHVISQRLRHAYSSAYSRTSIGLIHYQPTYP
jgi:hypothetical protein